MSAPVYVTPQCPGCDGEGCARCAWSGAAPPIEGVDRCPACAQGWRECECVEAVPCVMDVAAGYAAEVTT